MKLVARSRAYGSRDHSSFLFRDGDLWLEACITRAGVAEAILRRQPKLAIADMDWHWQLDMPFTLEVTGVDYRAECRRIMEDPMAWYLGHAL